MKHKMFFVFFAAIILCCRSDEVEYYKDIINQQIDESLNHEHPKDAFIYAPNELQAATDFGTFDFIIVGAGSTGAVLANRLSEVFKWKILLLEAGRFGNNITDIPNMMQANLLSNYNWGYKSIPQTTACLDMVDQRCDFSRGKGVGGTSLINGLIYSRGNKIDFDTWESQGNPGWSYKKVLPYFKKSEHFEKTDPEAIVDYPYHGLRGPLSVEYSTPRYPLIDYWLKANKEKGYKIADYNGREPTGAAIPQVNTKKGRRADVGNAFIKPIRTRSNLIVSTESLVTELVTSGNTVTGVIFVRGGKIYHAKAAKEVILSAGSIGSPQILMLSGIGPAEHLKELGIKTLMDLSVGENLRNHPVFYGLLFNSNLDNFQQPLEKYIKDYLRYTGSLTYVNNIAGVGFYETRFTKKNYPDIEILMFTNDGFLNSLKNKLSNAKEKTWQHLQQSNSFQLRVSVFHAKSVGSVKLKSKNPYDYPLIDAQFLSDRENRDIDTMYEGLKIALDLVTTTAYGNINATLVRQNVSACATEPYLSKTYWYCLIRQFTDNEFHPTGSCSMGPDPKDGAVVDTNCNVHGIKKLRVADSSIFPLNLSGHPNAVCSMIGEKLSDMIKREYLRENM